MESAWFDPFVFALTCLGGGGLLLALGLGCAPARGTWAAWTVDGLLGLLALAADVFAVVAVAWGQPVALWGAAGTFGGLYLLLVAFPWAFVRRATEIRAPRSRWARLAPMLALAAFCPFFALGLVYWPIHEPEVLTDATLAILVQAAAPPPVVNVLTTFCADVAVGE